MMLLRICLDRAMQFLEFGFIQTKLLKCFRKSVSVTLLERNRTDLSKITAGYDVRAARCFFRARARARGVRGCRNGS
jgi:hypothetical protein